jgi:hypothetical protein
MTPFRSLALAAATCAALSGCRGGGGGGGGRGGSGPKVTLRYHPPAGAAYHYALQQQNSMKFEHGPMAAMPEQSVTMHMYFTQLVGGPAHGGTAVTVTFDSTAIESPGMAMGGMQPALDRMRGIRSALVYDDRMHVVSAAISGVAGEASPMTDQMGKNVKSLAFPLPEGPVGVGDSWTAENDLPLSDQLKPSAPIKSKTTLTVKEIRVAGADTSVLLAIETTFPGGPIEFTQPASEGVRGGTGTMRLSGTLSGEQLYSLTRSAQLRATMGGTMRINVKGAPPSLGEMTIAMTQQTNLQLTR